MLSRRAFLAAAASAPAVAALPAPRPAAPAVVTEFVTIDYNLIGLLVNSRGAAVDISATFAWRSP